MPRPKKNRSFGGLKVRVQLVKEGSVPYSEPIKCSTDVVSIVEEVRSWDREVFLTLSLDVKNRVLGVETTAIGTLNATMITPREVFKGAILANAAAIILVHLHPSGSPEPSSEDRAITRRLARSGELLGIQVLDHVIVTQKNHFSFTDIGMLRELNNREE